MSFQINQKVIVIHDLDLENNDEDSGWLGQVGIVSKVKFDRDEGMSYAIFFEHLPYELAVVCHPYEGGFRATFKEKELQPCYDLGDKVALRTDEGLDLPSLYMGKVGKIDKVVTYEGSKSGQSYWVVMPDGNKIFCEYYHIVPVLTLSTKNVELDFSDKEEANFE